MENFHNPGGYGYDPSGGAAPPPQQQQQQGYYDGSGGGYYGGAAPQPGYYPDAGSGGGGMYPGGYGNDGMAAAPPFYPSSGGYDYPSAGAPSAAAATAKDGSYYWHDQFVPQILGYPVGALAFDEAYQAVYVASVTQSMSSTRWRSHRASLLVAHHATDHSLYSSVAGHPEASPSTLRTVYEAFFGIAKTVPLPPGRQHIPPHAHRAAYGGSDAGGGGAVPGGLGPKQQHGHLGISELLPLDGYVASVSPAAVRIHSHGGLQCQDYDIEGMVSATIHPHSDRGGPTHISVGGIPCNSAKHREQEVHCMDLWQGLRIVSSRSFRDRYDQNIAVAALATSHDKGSIVAGCTDGHLRILDGSLREVATVKSHAGGVASVAVSPDGMLIATCGYSSRHAKGKEASLLYAFPDPSVHVFDIRRLGRAGIPHPFAGVRGGPHHVEFLPDLAGHRANRLVVASGQSGGGLQIMVPFEAPDETPASFFQPPLEQGESITATATSRDDLALGTSGGRVLRYKLAGYRATTTKHRKKLPLATPPFVPPIPPVPLDPELLLEEREGPRRGTDEVLRALCSAYVCQADPKLSCAGNTREAAVAGFGGLGGRPVVPPERRALAAAFLEQAAPNTEGDFLWTVPTAQLEVDLLRDHNPVSKRYMGKKARETKPNPNKFVYNHKLSSICYEAGVKQPKGKYKTRRKGKSNGEASGDLPHRYRLQIRPNFKSSGAFDPSEHNDTGLIPGWDYSPTMPNSFAPPVLLMLYFVPELRSAVLASQYNEKIFSTRAYEKALSPELGFVFHQIESLSRAALVHPIKPGSDPLRARVGAWVPSNFLTALSTMPEAEQLQILDGSPAAVDSPRRPEAFYRFLAYQLDKELSKSPDKKLMDSLHGIDFVSSNEFITGSGPPSKSSTRAMTLDLSYDIFQKKDDHKTAVRFGQLLQHSLCRETRLRAWNSKSKAYETIVQRKIVTSLPRILTISCACAGRKEEDGMWVWRTDDGEPFLPETVEVELEESGNILVKQMKTDETGQESWSTFGDQSKLPEFVSKLVSEASTKTTHRYRLDAVLSFINDDLEAAADDEHPGHHVLHARVGLDYKKRVLGNQQEAATALAEQEPDPTRPVLTAGVKPDVLKKRCEQAERLLSSENEEESPTWVLYNGFAVSKTVVEDARAFHVSFKEPCLIVYREIDGSNAEEAESKPAHESVRVPPQVMNARSLSSLSNKNNRNFNMNVIEKGKLLAFDAEFVSVQEAESTLTETGSKIVLRETRHAVGRISIIDCTSRETIIDDHVLPKERVVDYLTRFSGIVAEDLDPAKSPHNLISTRNAYLKLRYMMEQGCIFVGHGLRQDFATVNLPVPPNQILDTVEMYHQPGMRYISLRYLTNYVLGRDMQQDVHDSVEDAMASFELYEKALEWKQQGVFDQKLQEIYLHGKKTDWKLGVENG